VILAAVASGLALVPAASVSAASGGFCSVGKTYSGTTITWTGKGNGHTWADAANWTPKTVPDAHQKPAAYQAQYVCIGTGKGGKPAAVTIAGRNAFHVAGLDIGQGARLTIQPGGRIFLGAAAKADVVGSFVEKHSVLQIDAATLGGNSPLKVFGTLRWTGQRVGVHKDVATQTSSECVFDPSIKACPGQTTPGGGRTIIAAGGKMLVDGVKFGGADLGDQRVIDNFGTITLTHLGYIAMSNRTQLIDEPHSVLDLDGQGGIYRATNGAGGTPPAISQQGKLVRNGVGTQVAVIGVPLTFGKKRSVAVHGGTLAVDAAKLPTAPVKRASGYGVGSCQLVKLVLCKSVIATAAQPQAALVETSSESGSPTVSNITIALAKGPAKLHGHATLGQAVDVTAPTGKTTHSTHLTFIFDATTSGLKPSTKPTVYRGTHAITLCAVHGLTAKNTSCVKTEKVAHSGTARTKGDLTVFVITIQPNARWLVTG
jgi:hypothetical protein